MKTAIFLFLLVALSSCKEAIDTQLLTGTWKPKDEAGLNTYSNIIFSGKDSVTAKTFAYGRLTSEISGKYKVDVKSNMLTTSYRDSISYDLEIKKLTKTELELYYLQTKQYQRYLRD